MKKLIQSTLDSKDYYATVHASWQSVLFWSNFLNTSHHLPIDFKKGTEWMKKKKKGRKKPKKTRESSHSWQQTEADRQLEFHTLNLSGAP